MEYTPIEQQTLDMMRRTDFKNLSKSDVLSIASKLGELRPDVAKEVIAQLPEFAKLIQSSMEEYKDILAQEMEILKAVREKSEENGIYAHNVVNLRKVHTF